LAFLAEHFLLLEQTNDSIAMLMPQSGAGVPDDDGSLRLLFRLALSQRTPLLYAAMLSTPPNRRGDRLRYFAENGILQRVSLSQRIVSSTLATPLADAATLPPLLPDDPSPVTGLPALPVATVNLLFDTAL
jgi:hypothetical protein